MSFFPNRLLIVTARMPLPNQDATDRKSDIFTIIVSPGLYRYTLKPITPASPDTTTTTADTRAAEPRNVSTDPTVTMCSSMIADTLKCLRTADPKTECVNAHTLFQLCLNPFGQMDR